MERLTGSDASFLYMENPVVHMHVTGVILLERIGRRPRQRHASAIKAAVTAPIASIRGVHSAARNSPVRPITHSTASAIGTDQTTRCAITSTGGIWASAFMYNGRNPHRR